MESRPGFWRLLALCLSRAGSRTKLLNIGGIRYAYADLGL
jgi:hypothetical protein